MSDETTPTAENASFLQTGFAATAPMIEKAEAERAAKRRLFRFFLKAPDGAEPNTAQVVFLDDTAVSFREHHLPLNGEWGKHFFTCVNGLPDENGDPMACPLCRLDDHLAYPAVAFTIIDLREYQTKRKEKRKNEKRLLVCKMQALKTLKRQHEKRDGLTFAQFEVARTGDKAPNTGDDWDFEKKHTREDMERIFAAEIERDAKAGKDFLAPADYAKEFEPKSLEDLEKVAAEFSTAKEAGKEVRF